MMREDRLQAACDTLWDHWQNGRRMAALPEDVRPVTREDAYAIQARVAERSAWPLFGWKIAATSAAGQKHIGVDGPLAGRLLRERAYASGDVVPYGNNHMRVAEAEFAFRMRIDLAPRDTEYSIGDVMDAVASMHPAIEIPDSRYDDFARVGAAQLIADNACAHYFVLGAAAPDAWRSVDLARHPVTGTVHGTFAGAPPVTRAGVGANVLGDPRVALAWLVNELSRLGLTLHAGEVITTGTCVTPLEIARGDRLYMDFGDLGSVEATLASDA